MNRKDEKLIKLLLTVAFLLLIIFIYLFIRLPL